MATIIEKTGKSVEDALQAALAELGVGAEDVNVEIVETPSKGIFGIFGTKPARIKVTLKEKPKSSVAQTVEASVSESVSEPPTTVNFRVVPSIDSLPRVDAEFKSDDEPAAEVPAPSKVENVEVSATVEVEEKPPFNRDEVIDKATNFLADVFSAMQIDVAINVRESDTNVILDLTEKDSALLIGKRGQTLDALQYVTNLAANRASDDRVRFILDVGNYRERREEMLVKMAKSVADRVVRIRQDVKMEPMSRHERRIVHTALQDNKRVETHSFGEEPYRYVVVSLKKKK